MIVSEGGRGPAPSAPGAHVLIVEAPYYVEIVEALADGARSALTAGGATFEMLQVPGAFEIPAAIAFMDAAARRDDGEGKPRIDGYVALGCLIRGETTHYDLICTETARGLQDLALTRSCAVGFGVLTVENEAQAWARARASEQDKGGEAARACLAMIALKRQLNLVPQR